jgi:hypothetical protein
MTRRAPFVRFFAILSAALQLASPGAATIADAVASAKGGFAALSHVESTTTSSCPAVHGVDCGICRFLSNTAVADPATPAWFELALDLPCPEVERSAPRAAKHSLPHGRAPPTL